MTKFVIREKNLRSFCTSTGFNSFDGDLDNAALFVSRENAEKGIKLIQRQLKKLGAKWSDSEDGVTAIFFGSDTKEEYLNSIKYSNYAKQIMEDCRDLEYRECVMEVVEVKLTLV